MSELFTLGSHSVKDRKEKIWKVRQSKIGPELDVIIQPLTDPIMACINEVGNIMNNSTKETGSVYREEMRSILNFDVLSLPLLLE